MCVRLTLALSFQCEDANGWTHEYRVMAAYALVMVFVFPIGACLTERRTGDDNPVPTISSPLARGPVFPGIPGLYTVLLYKNRKLLFPKYESRDEDGQPCPHPDNPAGWRGSFSRQPWWGQEDEDEDPYAALTEHQRRKIAQYTFLTDPCQSIA